MNSITTNYTTIVNKQKQLNYYGVKLVRQPASLADIRKTEEALHLTFNDELIELYSFADGTEFEAMTPSGLTGLIPIHSFLALNDAVEYYKQSMEYEESFHNHTIGYIPGKQMFPFLEDGAGNCYWVDLNVGTSYYGRIYWTNTYNSLSSMFEVIAEAYQKDIMFLDEDGYLDCDFEAFDKLSEGR
jgi:cell wall assembly regulator SMI1